MPNETDIGGAALSNGYEAPHDAQGRVYPEGTNNVEKAREQADAEEAGRQHVTEYHDEHFRDPYGWDEDEIDPRALAISARPYGEKAGEDYEVRKLAEKLGKTEQEVEERMAKDKKAMLEYGVAILNNKREFGEKLSLGEETFQVLADFAKEHPGIIDGPIKVDGGDTIYLNPVPVEADFAGEGMRIVGSFLRFGCQSRDSGVNRTETWDVGTYRDEGHYKSEERLYEGEPGSGTSVETTRTRKQQQEDLEHLKEVLGRVPAESGE